jgi:hypothetical protein
MKECPLLGVDALVGRSDLAEARVLREAIWVAAHDVLRHRAIARYRTKKQKGEGR